MLHHKNALQDDVKILLQSFRKYRNLITLTVLLALLAAVFEGAGIGLLIPFLQNIGSASGDTFQTGWQWVDQWVLGVGASQLERMYRIGGIILIATWLRSGFSYLSGLYAMDAQVWILHDLRMRILDQLQAVSLSFFTKTRSGEIISSLTNELGRVSQSMMLFKTIAKQGVLLLVYMVVMVLISWQLTLLVVVFIGLLSLGLTRLMIFIRLSGELITQGNAQLTSTIVEFINGIRTVIAFNMQAFERDRLYNASTQLSRAFIETGKRMLMVEPLSQAVVSTVLVGVILLATQYYILPGKLDVALLLTFLFALLRLVPIVHSLNSQRGQWAMLQAALSNIADLIASEGKPALPDGLRHAGTFRDALVFEDVSFSYEPGQPVLEHINLRIECGKTLAIVGASGAGKTTLADLVPRFYDPMAGGILWDGVDLREFTVASLRKRITVVSQDTFIFNDTVRANIGYGVPDAPWEAIREVAEKANALGFIEEMPLGFDTMLGDRGMRLSGGQRQRIAIARALLCNAEILILDEATSALDSVSEKQVQESLGYLMKGRTVIVIAHRLSTVENADKVVVLEEGGIVEEGTYQDLLEQKGQLWEYHALQFQLA